MAARDDLLIATRKLLHLLIDGQSPWTGLQLQLNESFGPSKPNATPVEVKPRYAYDPNTKGLGLIETPLTKCLVTIQPINRQHKSLFWHDQHPTLPGAAYVRNYHLQWDVWAPTPVLCDNLCDALENAITRTNQQLWDSHGIGLNIDDFQDAPYEVDSGIYRAFARGYCTVAVFTAT